MSVGFSTLFSLCVYRIREIDFAKSQLSLPVPGSNTNGILSVGFWI